MRAWITKHALTNGIVVVDDAQIAVGRNLVSRSAPGLHQEGDWWDNEADARNAAEHMRRAEIANLREELNRLEALDFGATTDESASLRKAFL